jgi:pimeloyl-ACP methyl ester carboxylesterase
MAISRQRVLLVALAVIAGIALAVAIDVVRLGGPRLWLASHGLPPVYLGGGEMVATASGRELYLDCRGSGSPTVVLEAGAGSGAGSWSPVFDDIAATTRTCAYDRAGLGSSPSAGRRTLDDAARDLRSALAAAGEAAPFVVVGHSLGGAYGRVFAAAHRAETVALVLVDSFDPDLQEDRIHPLLGALRPEYEDGLDGLRRTVEAWEGLDWATSEGQLRDAHLGDLRVAVLVAPRYEPRLDEATNERIAKTWVAAYESLSSGVVTHETAHGSGHVIPVDRPDAVVDLVRRVVGEMRAGP